MGTKRHAALAAFNQTTLMDPDMDQESIEAIEWASEYINLHSSDCVVWETEISIACGAEGDGIKGTPDATDNVFNVFDFKWRERDYEAQMAAYALGLMQLNWLPKMKCHLLFGEQKKAVVHEFEFTQAQRLVDGIIRDSIDAQPQPCDYCNWCAKAATCPAMIERVEAVSTGREDWQLEQYHSSAITDPNEMAKALTLARALKHWCESVEYHAKELAGDEGLPGFKVQTRKGKRTISDLNEACKLSGIPPDEFVKICSAPFSKIEKLYFERAEFTSKAAASKELAEKLKPVIQRGRDSKSLVKQKEK